MIDFILTEEQLKDYYNRIVDNPANHNWPSVLYLDFKKFLNFFKEYIEEKPDSYIYSFCFAIDNMYTRERYGSDKSPTTVREYETFIRMCRFHLDLMTYYKPLDFVYSNIYIEDIAIGEEFQSDFTGSWMTKYHFGEEGLMNYFWFLPADTQSRLDYIDEILSLLKINNHGIS